MKYAGFWQRVIARFLDIFILTFVAVLISLALNSITGISTYAPGNYSEQAMIFILLFLLMLIYEPIFVSSSLMATPGKMAVGLCVVRSNSKRVGFFMVLLRRLIEAVIVYVPPIIFTVYFFANKTSNQVDFNFIATLGIFSIIFIGIVYALQLATEKRQTMYDMMADIVVVKKSTIPTINQNEGEIESDSASNLPWIILTSFGLIMIFSQLFNAFQKNHTPNIKAVSVVQNPVSKVTVVDPAAKKLMLQTQAAEQGNADAQNNLGLMHQKGTGVPKDASLAVTWYIKAAEQGNADAQNNLGVMHQKGTGVPKDASLATMWYRKAAEQGNAYAQNNLGVMYEKGTGVPKDASLAVTWFSKAAEQGNADAQINLGVMYKNGAGVPKDASQAVTWFSKAAEQGDARAQNNLGVMYDMGEGVAKDYTLAYAWYNIATTQGKTEHATENRNNLESKMTPDQIAEAQSLSTEWRVGQSLTR